jgi:hypothetical protein
MDQVTAAAEAKQIEKEETQGEVKPEDLAARRESEWGRAASFQAGALYRLGTPTSNRLA